MPKRQLRRPSLRTYDDRTGALWTSDRSLGGTPARIVGGGWRKIAKVAGAFGPAAADIPVW